MRYEIGVDVGISHISYLKSHILLLSYILGGLIYYGYDVDTDTAKIVKIGNDYIHDPNVLFLASSSSEDNYYKTSNKYISIELTGKGPTVFTNKYSIIFTNELPYGEYTLAFFGELL